MEINTDHSSERQRLFTQSSVKWESATITDACKGSEASREENKLFRRVGQRAGFSCGWLEA